jgi:glycine/D-amino acid oxidase-like deaminating enzyme
MDLRTGQCYWPLKSGLLGVYPPLEADAACDVAIVGGGITGALIAHRLTHAGHSCILLDRRDIGWGSTLASTALVQYEIDVPLVRLGALIGADDAALAYRMCDAAVGELGTVAERLGAPVDFQRRPSLYLGREEPDIAALEAESRARRAIGIDAEFLDGATLGRRFGIRRPCAILSANAAQVDPYRLTHALLAEAISRGLRVFDRTEAAGFEPGAAGFILPLRRATMAEGPRVIARNVVYATGYEAQGMLRQKIATLRSTYALATEPLGEGRFWPERCLVWETGDPYFYLRATSDGRAMMGGEDAPFRSAILRDRLIGRNARRLVEKFGALFPSIGAEAAYCWAGTFGVTRDGLGYCGESPEYPGAVFALGFGGNGMTFGVIMARIVEDLVAGRGSEGARLFRFDR